MIFDFHCVELSTAVRRGGYDINLGVVFHQGGLMMNTHDRNEVKQYTGEWIQQWKGGLLYPSQCKWERVDPGSLADGGWTPAEARALQQKLKPPHRGHFSNLFSLLRASNDLEAMKRVIHEQTRAIYWCDTGTAVPLLQHIGGHILLSIVPDHVPDQLISIQQARIKRAWALVVLAIFRITADIFDGLRLAMEMIVRGKEVARTSTPLALAGQKGEVHRKWRRPFRFRPLLQKREILLWLWLVTGILLLATGHEFWGGLSLLWLLAVGAGLLARKMMKL